MGVETRDHILRAEKQIALRPQVLAQAVLGQAARLLAQHPIHHVGQRFAAQHLTRLRHQLIVERVRERLLEQTFKVCVQAVLHLGIAGITHRPVGGHPLFKPSGIPTLLHVQHQVSAQAIEQAFTVFQIAPDLPFKQCGHVRQQLLFKLLIIRRGDHRVSGFALIQAAALQVRRLAGCREYLGGRV